MQPTPARARVGISLQFFTNAAMVGALLPHYPEVKDHFDLSNRAFGLVVIAMPLGALVTAALAGKVIRRLGALNTSTIFTLLLAAAFITVGLSPWLWLLVAALVVAGMVDSILDTGQNVHGLRVERALGRSIINSLHALWSAGAVVGGLIGAWTVGAGWGVGRTMLLNCLVWAAVAVAAWWLGHLEGDDERAAEEVGEDAPRGLRIWWLALPVALLAICGTLVEEISNSWATLVTRDALGASPAVAGLAYVAAYTAQFLGRLTGDPLSDRWGRGRVALLGGGLIAAGSLVVLVAPGVAVGMVGWALLGFGCATLVPAAFAAADAIPGLAYGTGVALVGWLMRLGFLGTSPAFGQVADAVSLRAGMALPLGAGLLAMVLAVRVLPPGPATTRREPEGHDESHGLHARP